MTEEPEEPRGAGREGGPAGGVAWVLYLVLLAWAAYGWFAR
ncbi:MAG: hypothetical protein U0P81_09525 [Holophagaceae bacterium]